MPDISLTDFVDFVVRSGTPKLTKVRAIKRRPDYQPAFDYWKQLREGIQRFHRKGIEKRALLADEIGNVDRRKTVRYSAALQGYRKFLGRKQIEWFDPPSGVWSHQGLAVRINPELGLEIAGVPHVIKMYFKNERPTKNRLDVVIDMMRLVLVGDIPEDGVTAVLDVSAGRLFTPTTDNPQIEVLLKGEAACFVAMWDAV